MIIYGKQCCQYILEREMAFEKIYLSKKTVLDRKTFGKFREKIDIIDNKKAQALAKGGNHQGILMVVEDFEPSSLDQVKSHDFIVVLNEITDVGNIGSIVRSAHALGADAVIACGVRSLSFSGIARASSGALFELDFAVQPNTLDVLNELGLSGFTRYGAAMEGKDISGVSFKRRCALVLGSEGKGLSNRVLDKLDATVAIPMQRSFDSLNVGVAAGIIIHRIANDTSRINR